jgi:hypothetical protein
MFDVGYFPRAEHAAGTAALMVVLSWPIDRLEGGRDASDEN